MNTMLPVPRHWLFALAGVVWTSVGLLLCFRALGWAGELESGTEIALIATGCMIAVVGYIFGFSKIVRKNIARIHTLPARVSIFAFTALRGYILIAAMITLGIVLRSLAFPKYYLTVPYTAMGGALLIGSVQFYRQYFLVRVQ